MAVQARVVLKKRRARPFWFGHPWVFSGAIDRVRGQVRDGDLVAVCDAEGRTIGHGFFNGRSQIRVRLLAIGEEREVPVPELLRARLDRALDLRLERLRLPEVTNAWRAVHSEGDGLPGLVVDVLGRHLVLQVSSLGMALHLEPLLERLQERLQPAGLLERVVATAEEEEGLERREGVLAREAPPERFEVVEHGVRYFCDPAGGQKTGWYSDQRDNRLALAPLAREARVLDAFSYVGGFGLRMAREGAEEVQAIDSSEGALDLLRRGAEALGVAGRVRAEKGNVLRVLDHWSREGRRYDLVVLDPPKLVFKRKDLERGLRLYLELNLKGLAVLADGGILVTCSCSQHVSEEVFEGMLTEAAKHAGVRLQEIHRGGQGADHPILHPLEESRYLTCRALRVWGEGRPRSFQPQATGGAPRSGPKGPRGSAEDG